MKSEMCLIVVVSPLVSVMRDQVGQLKQLGFSAASIGLGEEYGEDEKAVREGKCELVFGEFCDRSVTPAARKCIFWSLPLEVSIV